MGLNTSVQQFVERLNDLNRYLLYFPEENPRQLDQNEIIEILDQAKAPVWHESIPEKTASSNKSTKEGNEEHLIRELADTGASSRLLGS
jgi:hypothetical protein